MTEAAVIDGGAPAPAESGAVINPSDAITAPTPLGSQVPEVDQPKTEPKSINDALDSAIAKVDAKQVPDPKVKTEPVKAEVKPKEPVKVEPQRGEHGHFAPKEQQKALPGAEAETGAKTGELPSEGRKPYHEPPSRFLDTAKADWGNVPDSVKEETHRALSNLEKGIEEHQRFREPLKPFDELARQNGTDLPSAIQRYVSFELALRQNPIAGLAHIAKDIGFDLKQAAAAILNQPAPTPDQNQQTIARLEARLAQAERRLGSVGETIQSQQVKAVHSDVEAFAAQHDDFNALASFIAEIIQSEPGVTLDDAYTKAKSKAQELAKSLGFTAPALAPAPGSAVTPPAPAAAPLNPAGQKSVSGSPATGAQPPRKKGGKLPPISETLDRVMR